MFDAADDSRGRLLGKSFSEPVDVRISPDGRRALVEAAQATCRIVPELWNLVDGTRITMLPADGRCAFRFRFSSDGNSVIGAVTQPDGIALWESQGGSELARYHDYFPEGVDTFDMFDTDVTNVMANGFSDDLKYVFAGTELGAVCVWPNPGAGPALINYAGTIVPRSFTQGERATFPVPEAQTSHRGTQRRDQHPCRTDCSATSGINVQHVDWRQYPKAWWRRKSDRATHSMMQSAYLWERIGTFANGQKRELC
ncbi:MULTISPECIES: hypothetical protein [Mesorhizobium]|uniref:hypothetical protein n=1 Tax=Mesorhizobium TaxID=68287 RepID=UPI00101252F3|nr:MULTISPECIES: hypothetical protein [Mesorhizobium]